MGLFPWAASGCAIANGRDEGVTKLLFYDSPGATGHGKILGGGMVGQHAGDVIGEIALAIEVGADVSILVSRFNRIPRWAKASTLLRRLHTAVARTCRRCAGKYGDALSTPEQSFGAPASRPSPTATGQITRCLKTY
jgi:hypothetical protein